MIKFKPQKFIELNKSAMLEIKLTPEQSDCVLSAVNCFGPVPNMLKDVKFMSVAVIVSMAGLDCVKYHGEASITIHDFIP